MTDHTEAVTSARALADQMYGDEAYDAIRGLLAFMDECGDAEKVYDAWLDAERETASQRKRAEAAEAERDRLRAAVERVRALIEGYEQDARDEGCGGELWSTTAANFSAVLDGPTEDTEPGDPS